MIIFLGLSLLDKTIQLQVSDHYADLLKHATGIETLENIIQTAQNHIQVILFLFINNSIVAYLTFFQSFTTSIERLKAKIDDPHRKLQTQTTMLGRLQLSCELLRRVIRILSLSKRLQTQLQAGSKELTKTAQTINELGINQWNDTPWPVVKHWWS